MRRNATPRLRQQPCHRVRPACGTASFAEEHTAAFNPAALLPDDRRSTEPAGVENQRGECRHRRMCDAYRELRTCGKSVPQHGEIESGRLSGQSTGGDIEEAGEKRGSNGTLPAGGRPFRRFEAAGVRPCARRTDAVASPVCPGISSAFSHRHN